MGTPVQAFNGLFESDSSNLLLPDSSCNGSGRNHHSTKMVLLIMNQTMTNYFLDYKYGTALFTVGSITQTIN